MKTKRELNRALLLAKNGSLIFCKDCEKIVGSINANGYRFIKISFICPCNTDVNHTIEITRGNNLINDDAAANNMPMVKDGVYICRKCEMPLLSIAEDRVLTYGFYVRCVCGECYDMRTNFGKRLGETLKLIKKNKKNPL